MTRRPALALPVVCAATAALLAGCGQNQQSEPPAETPSVELEAVNTPLPGAFAQAEGSDIPGVRSIANDSGTVLGGSEGLYGARPAAPCDREALITKLNGDKKGADAWAGARGIRSEEIGDHVRQLTPANLRSDTYVTDFRYENGHANPHPAVLQAGTAVLIDRHGVPVTRCATGDPLGQPARYDKEPRFQGKNWDGFRPAAIWVIDPARDEIPAFVMVDIDRHKGGDKDRVVTYFQVGRGGVYVVRPLPQGHPVPPAIPVEDRRPWPGHSDDRNQRPAPQPQNGQQPAQNGQNGQQPAQNGQQPAQNGQAPAQNGQQPAQNGQAPAQNGQPGQSVQQPNNQPLGNNQSSETGPSQNGPQPSNGRPDQTPQVPANQGGAPAQQGQTGQPGQAPAPPSAVAPRPR